MKEPRGMWHRAVQTRFSKGVPLAEEEIRLSCGDMSSGVLRTFDAFGDLYAFSCVSGWGFAVVVAMVVVVAMGMDLK